MSNEKASHRVLRAKATPLDQEISLVTLDGKCALQIALPSEKDALDRKELLEESKSYISNDLCTPGYGVASNYLITSSGSTITIQGNIEELQDALCRLHIFGNHLTEQKSQELNFKLSDIRLSEKRKEYKTKQARENRAYQDKRKKTVKEKSHEKSDRDPNAFFPKTRTAIMRTSSIPSCSASSKKANGAKK